MNLLSATIAWTAFASTAGGLTEQQGEKQMPKITIARSGSQPSNPGSAAYFTGAVRVDPLFPVAEPSRMSGTRIRSARRSS